MKKWCEIKMYMQANPATLRQAITELTGPVGIAVSIDSAHASPAR